MNPIEEQINQLKLLKRAKKKILIELVSQPNNKFKRKTLELINEKIDAINSLLN